MSKELLITKESSKKPGQSVLDLSHVTVYKGWKEVLKDISLTINEGEHVALVGNNGVGKTTLMRTILNEEEISTGKLTIPKRIKIAYVPQALENLFKSINDKSLTVLDYFLQARGLNRIHSSMVEIEKKLEINQSDQLLNHYGNLQAEYQNKGGYTIEHDAKVVLEGFNLSKKIHLEDRILNLSGGEKTKIFLAQALLTKANLLLLDEPSNHLDMDSIEWLGNYLKTYPGAIIAISHKPEFLDSFVQEVIELSNNYGLEKYLGNYTDYKNRKKIKDEEINEQVQKTQEETKRLEEIVNRLKAGSRSKMAKDREKKLKRVIEEMPKIREKNKKLKFRFELDFPSGMNVLKIKGLVKKYGPTTLNYSSIDTEIKRGEKIAIYGPVGAGKSTLLKIIAGELSPNFGHIEIGEKVKIGYYSQEMETLNPKNTVLEEIRLVKPSANDGELRSFLGLLLFSGQDVFKKISVLSHGERARVALAKVALVKPNFLILDEPSNHLDMDSKAVLSQALADYTGTVLIVTHDEEFLDKIGLNKIIFLPEGKIKSL